jgi:hypothetical protein
LVKFYQWNEDFAQDEFKTQRFPIGQLDTREKAHPTFGKKMEEHILDTNAEKQLSQAATDVYLTLV